MDCVVTPLKTLMGFSVHLNVQLKFYNLPFIKKGIELYKEPVGAKYVEQIETPIFSDK